MNECVYNEVPIIHSTNYTAGRDQGDAIWSRQRGIGNILEFWGGRTRKYSIKG